jgi:hypothetical protein
VDPRNQWSLERFASLTSPVSIFKRYLFSPDHRVTGIALILDDEADQAAISQTVNLSLARLGNGFHGYQIGMPQVSIELSRYAQKDFLHLPNYTILIIVIILLVIFRSAVEMAIPLLTVAVSVIWTLGIMAWSGITLSILTVVVPILQIAVGTAYCLYIYCAFKDCAPACHDALSALTATCAKTAHPTLIAVCTTIAGIASLMFTPIGAVRQFSTMATTGILALLVVVATFLPCVLAISWPNLRKRKPTTTERLLSPARIDKLVDAIVHHRWVVFTIFAIFAIVAVAGVFRIRVETNPLSYFKAETPISRHFHDVYHHLSGSFPLHLEIQAKQEDYFLSVDGIKRLTDHQEYLETLPGIDKTLSFADYIMLLNYITNQFKTEYYKIPESDFQIRILENQFKSLLGRDILYRYLSTSASKANITMLTRLSSARGFMETSDLIRGYCHKHINGEITCHTTGFGMLMSFGCNHLVRGQVLSLLITLVIIFFLIHLMFFSVRIGTIAIIANLFPIMVSFGAMGWLRIDLSMGTCLIASIVTGLAVDDSIHYLSRYKSAYKQEMDSIAAMRRTLMHIGQPIIATSVTISAGFSILILSNFRPTAVFGMLMMLAMASALSVCLVILPAMLSKVSPITLEEIFQLRIGGEQLQQRVPLLKGMTRFQVHRILRAGKIRQINSGDHLFNQGDVADCIYVVISGIFDAVIVEPSENLDRRGPMPVRVNRLEVGDVIGEMGVMTSGYRCMSVVAITAGEVLALRQSHLNTISRLYSRTACRFFTNLSSVLTEKLIKADHTISNTSILDEDTGLLNREAFFECYERELSRSRRFGESLSICYIEVDHTGDKVSANPLNVERYIRLVAKTVSAIFRKVDSIGRINKSTLAVMLISTASTDAGKICNRLKAAFRDDKQINEKLNAAVSCRFADLEYQWSDVGDGDIFDPIEAIHSSLQSDERHLLFVAPSSG